MASAATFGKRGSPNQILSTAVTFLFPFGGFLSPVPMQINWTGLSYKDISDLNAVHDFNKKTTFKFKNFHNGVATSNQLFFLPFED